MLVTLGVYVVADIYYDCNNVFTFVSVGEIITVLKNHYTRTFQFEQTNIYLS